MKYNTSICKQMPLLILFAIAATPANASDGIVKNADGNYVVTYSERLSHGTFHILFIPATKIDPSVRSSWKQADNSIVYRYRIYNGSSSKQYLHSITIEPINSLTSTPIFPNSADRLAYVDSLYDPAQNSVRRPRGWDAMIAGTDMGFRVGLFEGTPKEPNEPSGLPPGTGSDDFGYQSQDLPGLAVMKLMGSVINPPDKYSKYDTDEMLDPTLEVAKQFHALEDKDFVPRYAAVPTIAVPTPFDAAILLDRIRTHVATWPGKQLLDPAFATQLDRYMVAAANAYRSNQPKAGKEHIETLRRLLDHEHKYLDHDDEDNDDTAEHKATTRLTIDRLAARVLDFDLRYVLKRMEKEHEHEHDEGDRRKER